MTPRIAFGLCLILPTFAHAQIVPMVHPYSGLYAASGNVRLELAGPRFAGPRAEALGMKAQPAVEIFPLIRLPNQPNQTVTRPASILQRVKPKFVLDEKTDIDIPEVQDAIFFADTRAVRVRLHMRMAGTSLREAWIAQLKKYFDFLDRDSDGELNAYEAESLPSNRTMQQMILNGNGIFNPSEPGRHRADFDRDEDGKISFDEFVAYYRPATANLIRVQSSIRRDAYAEPLTDELFKLLDRDKDGKLSRAELAEAEKLISIADQNEDECLTALELVPNLLTRGINPAIPLYSPNSTANRAGAALQIYRLNAIPDAVMEQMLIRYDEDKNLRLNKVESGLDEAAFVKLDKNGDGELSISELMAWRDLPPDLAVEIIVGAVQGESVIKLLPGADGKPSPFAKHVTITPDGKATLQLGSQQMELFSPNSSTNFVPINRGYDLFFDQIDVKKQGYLTEQDLAGTQFQYMRVIFDIVDRNGDGRMAKKEYVDYVELQQSFTGVALAISHFTQTPSLFALLDANGDGRLSVREMRTAWERLKTLEPGGQFISKSALKPQAWLRFTMSRQMNQGLVGTNYNPMVQPPTKGPLWFRKMDRNSDGDVSRAEFPGRTEDFDKLDLDHDGLIGLDEAEAAEKVFRAVKP